MKESILVERDTKPDYLLVGRAGDPNGCALYINNERVSNLLKIYVDKDTCNALKRQIIQESMDAVYGVGVVNIDELTKG